MELAFSYEEVSGALTVVLCLAAFLIGAFALETLKKWDKDRCWNHAEKDSRMRDVTKGFRESVAAANKELTELRAATKGHEELKKELSKKKEQSKNNHARAEGLQKDVKDLKSQVEAAKRDAWKLQCQLDTINGGLQRQPTVGNSEHYRGNGHAVQHQGSLTAFNR